VSAPAAILVLLILVVFGVWLMTTVLGYLRRNAEANERIAAALEAANARPDQQRPT
jgi:hypothetical protein